MSGNIGANPGTVAPSSSSKLTGISVQ
ncbi:TPA: colicin release lysis protein [Escherichia coli]